MGAPAWRDRATAATEARRRRTQRSHRLDGQPRTMAASYEIDRTTLGAPQRSRGHEGQGEDGDAGAASDDIGQRNSIASGAPQCETVIDAGD